MTDEGWFKQNDLPNKLKAGLEQVIVGQGLAIIFNGLDKGEALVKVSYNGEIVTFLPTITEPEIKETKETVIPESTGDTVVTAITNEPTTRRRRTT